MTMHNNANSSTSLIDGLRKLAGDLFTDRDIRSLVNEFKSLAFAEYDLQSEMDAYTIGFFHFTKGYSSTQPPASLKKLKHSDLGALYVTFDAGYKDAQSGKLHVAAKFKYFHKEQV